MQPAEEVLYTPQAQKMRASNRELIRKMEDPAFRKVFLQSLKQLQKNDSFYFSYFFVTFNYSRVVSFGSSGGMARDKEYFGRLPLNLGPGMSLGSLKNKFHLMPDVKGILVEVSSGYVMKFRLTKHNISKELFDLRFDRDKANTDFKEWLYYRIRDIYEEVDCDDPRIDPLTDDKREELWYEAALLFRRYNQRATHINHLPGSIDPATLPMIKPDTVNNNILQILTLYDGPGSKRQRRLAPKK